MQINDLVQLSVVDYEFKGNDFKKRSITWVIWRKKPHWICSENNDLCGSTRDVKTLFKQDKLTHVVFTGTSSWKVNIYTYYFGLNSCLNKMKHAMCFKEREDDNPQKT